MSKSNATEPTQLKGGTPDDPRAFGKYYLLGLIARGGMAEVYRARLIRSDREPELLAIKVMRPSIAAERRFVDMFNSEGQLAMLLDNPSIVATREVGRVESRHFIAMEYLSGQDLTHILRRCQERGQRIPIPHAVYIASHIAEGLDYAHRLTGPDGRPLNIVNRDVSPSNVRVTYDGHAKMLDFGIAQALMKFTSEIGILKGKFSYMSPEQIRGMPVDARSDVFAAGIILHEMLTTEKLFRGDTEFALMEKVRKAEIQPPSHYNRRVSKELDDITMRALRRDIADRYQSAAEMSSDLSKILSGYNFDSGELKQFLRQLFRREADDEAAACEIALRSMPGSSFADDDHEDEDTQRESPMDAATRASLLHPAADAAVAERIPQGPPASDGPGEERSGGFWSRFRRKKPADDTN